MKKLSLCAVLLVLALAVVGAQQKSIPADMVRINGGTFTMGSPESEAGRDDDEGPQHQVTVSGFYMGKYEVTQKEYEEVMGANPSRFKGPNLPVEMVSWEGLDRQTGHRFKIPGGGEVAPSHRYAAMLRYPPGYGKIGR